MMRSKKALVLGGGGFIGHHLIKSLKNEGFWVRAVDIKKPLYEKSLADEFLIGDLRNGKSINDSINQKFDEIYQLAADMGGAGYLFSGNNDALVMHNSAKINLNVIEKVREIGVQSIFYSSSACVYPEYNQLDPSNPICEESSVYPAQPDSEYGWEKLFSERLYLNYERNFRINCKIGRYHNIFGPLGSWNNGKEKSPAALCRKIAQTKNGGSVEIWGDGNQTRSYLYIDDCIEATKKLTRSDNKGPYNIGSENLISINSMVDLISDIAGKTVNKIHVDGPIGVKGRVSDNKLIQQDLKWSPSTPLKEGLINTYKWIEMNVKNNKIDK